MFPLLLISLLIVWAFLHGRHLRAQADEPQMLMSDPRQCCAFFKRTASGTGYILPPLTKEDRL